MIHWLVRAKRWAQNPPSTKRVMLVFGVVAVCLAIVLAEWLGFWPEWATMDPTSVRIR